MKGLFRKLTSGAFRWGRGAVILALCAAVLATAAYAIYSATAEGEGEVTVASYTQSYTLTDAETGEEIEWTPSMRLEAGAYRLRIAAAGTARTGFCVVTTQEADGAPVSWYTAPVEPDGEVEIELTVYTEGRISMDALWGELSDYWPDAEATEAVFIGTEPVTHEFEPVFENASNILYRVGSGSAVELGDLFRLPGEDEDEETEDSAETEEEDEAAPVDSKALTVTAEYFNDDLKVELKEEDYVVSEDDWKKSTIKLTGVGPVLITLREGEGEECKLLLEVVDGVNVTEYADLPGSGNIVLLSDIELPASGYVSIDGAALYGNGFTIDASACTAEYICALRLHNGELNNVAVTGPVYDADAAETTRTEEGFAVVRADGESSILGCCLTGGAAPLRVVGGEVYAESTALCGGSFANISYFGGDLTLNDVVTVNQADAKLGAAGLGIVACGEDMSQSELTVIGGALAQYNSISDEGIERTDDTLPAALFGEDAAVWQYPAEEYRSEGDPVWVSAAIVSLTDTFGADNIMIAPDKTSEGAAVSDGAALSGYVGAELGDGYVYAPVGAEPKTAPACSVAGQFDMSPVITLDWPEREEAEAGEDESEAGYCFYDEADGVLRVFYAPEGSYVLDPAVLTAEKFGLKLVKNGVADKASSYRVTFDGEDVTGGSIDLSGEDDTHRLEITFTDPYNYSCSYGTLTWHDRSYTIAVTVVAEQLGAEETTFAFGAEGIAALTEEIELDGESGLLVLPEYAGEGWESMTFAERTVYYPVVEMRTSDGSDTHGESWQALFPVFAGAVTITTKDADGETVVYDAGTTALPAGFSAADAVLYDAGAVNTATGLVVTEDGVLCYTQSLLPSESGSERSFAVMYRFTDAAGQTYVYFIGYHCAEQTEVPAAADNNSETTGEPEDVGSDDPNEATDDAAESSTADQSVSESEVAPADDNAEGESITETEAADETPENSAES